MKLLNTARICCKTMNFTQKLKNKHHLMIWTSFVKFGFPDHLAKYSRGKNVPSTLSPKRSYVTKRFWVLLLNFINIWYSSLKRAQYQTCSSKIGREKWWLKKNTFRGPPCMCREFFVLCLLCRAYYNVMFTNASF